MLSALIDNRVVGARDGTVTKSHDGNRSHDKASRKRSAGAGEVEKKKTSPITNRALTVQVTGNDMLALNVGDVLRVPLLHSRHSGRFQLKSAWILAD